MIRLAVLLACLGTAAVADDCTPQRMDIRGDFGSTRLTLELADSNRERARGLMYRESLPDGHGMLFLYPRVGRPAFWMKNTLIPLDMLFITPAGRLQHIHENAVPGDLTPIDGGDGILAVLEIAGGQAAALGLTEGAELRHPGLEQAIALWPCVDPQ